jgi:hypothetical protein
MQQVVALLSGAELLVANAGDSRCVASRRGAAVAMTTDHKPTDAAENERIRKARLTIAWPANRPLPCFALSNKPLCCTVLNLERRRSTGAVDGEHDLQARLAGRSSCRQGCRAARHDPPSVNVESDL